MKPTRRQFFWLSGAATLGAGSLAWLMRNQRGRTNSGLQRSSRTSWALGSEVTITTLHPEKRSATAAVDAAFAELATVERVMSIYREDSQLSLLNRHGKISDPHPYFVEVLRAAGNLSRRTAGAFDVTVQPLWAVYADAQKKKTVASDAAVGIARKRVDWRRVKVSDTEVRLTGAGTAITLNGIAQGFAADRANQAIRSHGVEHALINTGEVSALGHKESGSAWTIGIQHPRVKEAYVSIAQLDQRCLATSGDYATEFSKDHRLNHLFDPHTGRSPSELASVSICAATAMQADALSTATFVLGVERGLKLIHETAGADAFMVLKDGQIVATDGFPVSA